jgi:hypothetical protein
MVVCGGGGGVAETAVQTPNVCSVAVRGNLRRDQQFGVGD